MSIGTTNFLVNYTPGDQQHEKRVSPPTAIDGTAALHCCRAVAGGNGSTILLYLVNNRPPRQQQPHMIYTSTTMPGTSSTGITTITAID